MFKGDFMEILEETKFIMNKYKVKANKNLGQNFLIDEQVIKDIIGKQKIKSRIIIILTNRIYYKNSNRVNK